MEDPSGPILLPPQGQPPTPLDHRLAQHARAIGHHGEHGPPSTARAQSLGVRAPQTQPALVRSPCDLRLELRLALQDGRLVLARLLVAQQRAPRPVFLRVRHLPLPPLLGTAAQRQDVALDNL